MAIRTIDIAERRARLALRHRHAVSARTDDVVAIADDLVALHSTDPVTVHLSAAARMRAPALEPLGAALYEERSLVRHHAMRRTLWVFGHETARLAHHASTTTIAAVQRRNALSMLAAGGVADPGSWLDAAAADVDALLREAGPLTAREIGTRLPELARPIPVGGGGAHATTMAAHTRVLLVLGFEGRVIRTRPTGTWINGQYRWASAEQWLPGGFGEGDVRTAAAGLARRWLRAFGPGTRTDLQWWAGWTVAVTKAALADVGAVEVELDEGPGWVLPDDVDPVPDAPPTARLLPGLDPSTMGWKQRGFHLDPAHVPVLFDRNGNGGPTLWVDGRIVGGWVQRRDGTIAMQLLEDVGARARAALEEHAGELEALLGDVRFTVRFPAPLQAQLLG
ncbi:winged helix DNA-binding domain-containing protein [Pseudonocardia sp.]|uniref:winged helix DNA-binding domain-containing protein n=1 Tax=Pseudonocardia sp. TaxID=60912 RepID=UPI002612B22F|nr:winged helix DNA-binding domain-containing protein [Pseudonocardia sp.]